MLHLDANDPLDRMILKELGGEPVLFDEWEDALDELAEEPDCEQILQERGLKRENVLREAEAYRADCLARLGERGLPANDRFALCRLLCEQAQAEPSVDLLRLYCEVLCGSECLLDSPADQDQLILQYLDFLPERDELLAVLTQRKELSLKFAELKKQNRSPRPVDCDTKRKYEVLQCFTSLFELPPETDGSILLGNLETYMQIATASPVLKSVEPLLLFRLLTRRRSYMCSTPDLSVQLDALWNRDSGSVEKDNGRNFAQYRTYLQLFLELCSIYRKDILVNLPLCWYGLDQITVLGDFYRQHMISILDESTILPFPEPVEEIVEDSMFSCFEHGYSDNVLFVESGLSMKELQNFQSSSRPSICYAQDRLSDYMNNHAAELTEQFLHADSEDVKQLCRNILEDSQVNSRILAKDLPLFLASINGGLMDLEDYFANQYLVQAGQALTDGLTETSIPIE